MQMMRFYIVHTLHGIMICKHGQSPERDLVASIEGCLAYVGPLHFSGAADYLTEYVPDLSPIAEIQLRVLQESADAFRLVTIQPREQTARRSWES